MPSNYDYKDILSSLSCLVSGTCSQQGGKQERQGIFTDYPPQVTHCAQSWEQTRTREKKTFALLKAHSTGGESQGKLYILKCTKVAQAIMFKITNACKLELDMFIVSLLFWGFLFLQ